MIDLIFTLAVFIGGVAFGFEIGFSGKSSTNGQ